MDRIFSNFKKNLIERIKQQAKSDSQELNYIIRKFKYFDTNENGKCDYNTFSKVIAKIGLFITSKEEEYKIFNEILKNQKNDNLIDSNSKYIDYIEFSNLILEKKFRNKSNTLKVKSEFKSSRLHGTSQGMIQFKDKYGVKNVNEKEYHQAVIVIRNAVFEINLLHILNHMNDEIQNNQGRRRIKYTSLLKCFLDIGLGYKFEVLFYL